MSTLRLPRSSHHRHARDHPRLGVLSRLLLSAAGGLLLLFAFFAAEAV